MSGAGTPAGRRDSAHGATQDGKATGSLFVPVLMVVVTLLLMAGFQTVQLLQARDSLLASRASQDRPLEDSRKVRGQLDSLAKGIGALATGGNENARRLDARLQQLIGGGRKQ